MTAIDVNLYGTVHGGAITKFIVDRSRRVTPGERLSSTPGGR
jgi:hypothetical protein